MNDTAECYYCGEVYDIGDLELVRFRQSYKAICPNCY
jgi:hypothetical protein